MKGGFVKKEKERVQNKIVSLLLCILYEPNVIPWTELKRIAIYLCGTQNLGPKGITKVALYINRIYSKVLEKYKKNHASLFSNKTHEPLTLGEILDNNSVFCCKGIYDQILDCINEKNIINYLKEDANRAIKRAESVIKNNNIVIIKKTYGYASPIECFFTLLQWKIERIKENKAAIYLLTKELYKELANNQRKLVELGRAPIESCEPPKLNIENWNEEADEKNVADQEEWVKKAEELIKKLKWKYITTTDEDTQVKVVAYIEDVKSILEQRNYYDLRVAVNEVTEYLR